MFPIVTCHQQPGQMMLLPVELILSGHVSHLLALGCGFKGSKNIQWCVWGEEWTPDSPGGCDSITLCIRVAFILVLLLPLSEGS